MTKFGGPSPETKIFGRPYSRKKNRRESLAREKIIFDFSCPAKTLIVDPLRQTIYLGIQVSFTLHFSESHCDISIIFTILERSE